MVEKIEINTKILDEAIKFATEAHKNDTRKGTKIPYITHPMEAASIVASMTEDIDVISAAILHDTVEDNKNISLEDIEEEFGSKIRQLVKAESEKKEDDEVESWRRRKQATIDYFKDNDNINEKIIALGDKLSNIRAIHRDYLIYGEELWSRFNQKDKHLQGWYYKWMAEVLKSLSDFPAYREYCELVNKVFNN